MILMGTGTSHGVPVIGCTCSVCRSRSRKDKRDRCSAFVSEPAQLVIDTGPEFRLQAIRHRIKSLDAVLLTHPHADHLHGLDDLRSFSHTQSSDCNPANPRSLETQGNGLPVYANASTIAHIRKAFDYIFRTVQLGGGKPKLDLVDCAAFSAAHPLQVKGLEIIPVPLLHGELPDSGWLLTETRGGVRHSIAYLTDCSLVPEDSIRLVQERSGVLEHLVIDGLRVKPHATHLCFEEALAVAGQLGARHTWLTHVTHDLSHRGICKFVDGVLPGYPALQAIVQQGGSVGPAYDGLVLKA